MVARPGLVRVPMSFFLDERNCGHQRVECTSITGLRQTHSGCATSAAPIVFARGINELAEVRHAAVESGSKGKTTASDSRPTPAHQASDQSHG
jgi:hypothetical protein